MSNKNACKWIPLTDLLLTIVDNRGKSCPTSESGIPLIATNCIKNTSIYPTFENIRYVSENTLHTWFRAELKPNDILFVNKGTPGRVCLVPNPINFCAAQDMVGLRADPNKIYFKYLFAVLRSDFIQKKIENYHVGIAIPHFKKSDMKELLIPVPSDKIQHFIGDIYFSLSSKIENNNAISAKLESLAKTIYDYWFLQFEFPNEEGKPYKSSGGKMVWNEELKREIPEGWEVTSLRGKYNIVRGISYTSKDIESGKGLPMLNLACIDTSRNYRDGELKYTTGRVTESEKLHGGELLIACTDLTRNADIVGCPILVPQDGKTYTYSMDLAKIYSTASSLTNMYLYQSLRTDFYHRYIKKWASGTNVLHLNLDGLNWYSIALPPVLLQKKYTSLISTIEKEKSDILAENRQLTSLRDFLLPLLMNGQVTFKGDA